MPVYCALFCPYLHKDKATKQATAFGLIGAAFLWNTAKPLFFLISFPLSFLFQCLTHTEKALKDFLPVTQARHGAGRVIHTNLDYCQSLYISFIFAVLIIANLFSITANNLIYDAEEKNGLFAATSATRVIIFAVRISFLIRSQ